MCFNGQTLSAFVDNELGSAQQSSVKEHLLLCSLCRKEVDTRVILKNQLQILNNEADSFSIEAVWTRLSHSTAPGKGLGFWHREFILSPALMISLSFLFITVLGAGLFFSVFNKSSSLAISNSSNLSFESAKYPFEIPIDNVESVLAYFNIHDEPLEFFIQLPGPSGFLIQGEPRLLKKNDYIAGR